MPQNQYDLSDLGASPTDLTDIGGVLRGGTLNRTPTSSQGQTAKPELPSGIRQAIQSTGDFALGAGKSIANAGLNAGGYGARLLAPTDPGAGSSLLSLANRIPKPQSTAEQIGYKAADVAMMMAPGSAPLKAAKVLAPTSKFSQMAIRAGLEGIMGGTIGAAESGDAKEGAQIGAGIAGATVLGFPIERIMARTGEKIQTSTIRARQIDYKDGFRPDTLTELGLKGNLNQSYNQVITKLGELRQARDKLFDPSTTIVDIGRAFDRASTTLEAEIRQLKHSGQSSKLIDAFDSLRKDVYEATGGSGVVDIQRAEDCKEALGLLGAWAYGRQDLESNALEKAANATYLELKKAIEDALPKTSKELVLLNREMHKLIPVKNAMLARLPVEERNRVLSLPDIMSILPALISGNVKDMAMLAVTRGQKSLRFGNFLARNAQSATGASTGVAKVVGGLMTEPRNE